jgi:hypothetical protein
MNEPIAKATTKKIFLDSRFRENDRKISVCHAFRVFVIPDLIGNPETLHGNDKHAKSIT